MAKEMPTNQIYTGTKWLGQKVLIDSSGDKEIDAALKSTFHDRFHRTAPLDMWREDVQIVIKYQNDKNAGVPIKQKAGQMPLFSKGIR